MEGRKPAGKEKITVKCSESTLSYNLFQLVVFERGIFAAAILLYFLLGTDVSVQNGHRCNRVLTGIDAYNLFLYVGKR